MPNNCVTLWLHAARYCSATAGFAFRPKIFYNAQEQLDNTEKYKSQLRETSRRLLSLTRAVAERNDYRRLKRVINEDAAGEGEREAEIGPDAVLRQLLTAEALCTQVAADRNMVVTTLLYRAVYNDTITLEEVEREWGAEIASMVDGVVKVARLSRKRDAVRSENFRNLLLTLASDLRVIVIMIVDRLVLMELINHHPNQAYVEAVAREAATLYAPLAHRLGLYAVKSTLEDLSLKYLARETYTMIARKLNETKTARDAYIAAFIEPVKERLEKAGLNFEIKGRTKSIHSIWNKMRKQGIDLDRIYDLFAIRVIIDTPVEKEKTDCWMAFSVITDMYQPNPARMKDWISVPKSNGYESLHITVNGPEQRWVEVQIRTRRMDAVAEKGLAAHWKYKGIKAENDLDSWMGNVREMLEAAHYGDRDVLNHEMRMDVYDKEVFVFTPKGDLFRLPLGATVLDFAFAIHTKVGSTCTGARVNGKNQRIGYKLHSGDTVEILTQATQTPKQDWLGIVTTSKARTKIRQTLNEMVNRQVEVAKELLMRRFKNRKIELDEAVLMKVIKKAGYKTVTDFYRDVADEKIDAAKVFDLYQEQAQPVGEGEKVSAEEFVLAQATDERDASHADVLVIGEDVKGLNYKLSRCCNPIYGDEVFGFISGDGVVKIHRNDCPNARHLRQRYPYRVIASRWSGKIGAQLGVTLSVVGHDDIGIVTNITSIINKEKNTTLRAISINSHDGLFQGHLTVGVPDNTVLQNLIKKIKTVKGVKNVERSK